MLTRKTGHIAVISKVKSGATLIRSAPWFNVPFRVNIVERIWWISRGTFYREIGIKTFRKELADVHYRRWTFNKLLPSYARCLARHNSLLIDAHFSTITHRLIPTPPRRRLLVLLNPARYHTICGVNRNNRRSGT